MKKKIIELIVFTLLAKIIAFGKELVLAYCYGASETSDIYLISTTIPVILFGIFSNGITSGFVPIFTKLKSEKGHNESVDFTNKVLECVLCLCLILTIIYFIFKGSIINFLANGFCDESKTIAIGFANITILAMGFSCVTHIMNVYLQASGHTSIIGLLSVPLNIVIALFIYFSYRNNSPHVLAIGYVWACIVQCVTFVIISYKYRFKFRIKLFFEDENIRFFMGALCTLVIGSSVQQINVLIDKMLASTVSIGAITALEYANKVLNFIAGLFILSVVVVQFPLLAKEKEDLYKFRTRISESFTSLFIFMIPIAFVLFVYSKDIIRVIYLRGAFNQNAWWLTSEALFYYGMGIIPIGVRELLSKVFYAQGDFKTPVTSAMIGVVLNCVLNFVFVKFLGLGGIAAATSIAAFIVSTILYYKIYKKLSYSIFSEIGKKILIITGGAFGGILGSYLFYCIFEDVSVANIFESFFVFTCIYFLILFKYKIFDYHFLNVIKQ